MAGVCTQHTQNTSVYCICNCVYVYMWWTWWDAVCCGCVLIPWLHTWLQDEFAAACTRLLCEIYTIIQDVLEYFTEMKGLFMSRLESSSLISFVLLWAACSTFVCGLVLFIAFKCISTSFKLWNLPTFSSSAFRLWVINPHQYYNMNKTKLLILASLAAVGYDLTSQLLIGLTQVKTNWVRSL